MFLPHYGFFYIALCIVSSMVSVNELKLNSKNSLSRIRVKILLHLKYDGKCIKISSQDGNKLKQFFSRS